ncbi:MAG: hypothetical protein WB770_06995 [Acidimicrobiales bacterium]
MTEKREMDAFAASIYGDRVPPTRADRWRRFKRVGLPFLAIVVIIVAVAVVTDIPRHESLAGERSAAAYLVSLVNGDVKPCAVAMTESAYVFRRWQQRQLNAPDRSLASTLLTQDADACSFTADSINKLSQIEEPGTGAGKYLARVIGDALSWTTSDALGAIEDFSRLAANPKNSRAAADLHARKEFLATDRGAALVAMVDAERYLKGPLPKLNIPAVRVPPA